MNPVNQFIEIAPDCPLREAIIPEDKGGKKSIAVIEYELLSGKPYGYTLEELKFATHVQHKQIEGACRLKSGDTPRPPRHCKAYSAPPSRRSNG